MVETYSSDFTVINVNALIEQGDAMSTETTQASKPPMMLIHGAWLSSA